jgi:hypothetical protein
LAAALFGPLDGSNALTFTVVKPSDRFHALLNGTVDVLADHTTLNMERAVFEVSIVLYVTVSLRYVNARPCGRLRYTICLLHSNFYAPPFLLLLVR